MELKPCPFCGNEDIELKLEFDGHGGEPWHEVICNKCYANINLHSRSEIDTIKKWNRRAD